jgi:hypothetical protein
MSPVPGPGRDDLTDDPEVPQEDALDQRAELDGDAGADEADEPGDDAVEAVELGEADPADVAEQARSVGPDEDDYR